MSKYLHQLKWLDKKILDGYFGFNIVKLNELYDEDVLKNIKYFFDKESFEIDDISDTLVNGRSSIPHFANWFKTEVFENKAQVSEGVSDRYKRMFRKNIVLDDDGRVNKLRISIYVNSGTNLENSEIVRDLAEGVVEIKDRILDNTEKVHIEEVKKVALEKLKS